MHRGRLAETDLTLAVLYEDLNPAAWLLTACWLRPI
jgi:hypothetical protein